QNGRIGLTKRYKEGTGDPTQNFGHTVTLQLCWNSDHDQFEAGYGQIQIATLDTTPETAYNKFNHSVRPNIRVEHCNSNNDDKCTNSELLNSETKGMLQGKNA
ncbi:unnamed protein product, partial [Didymodactylos carnosus]